MGTWEPHYLSHELLQVVSGRLADGVNMVDQPGHAERAQFLIEELHPELACKQRHVLNDGEPDPPFGVFGQLDDGWQQGLEIICMCAC